MKRPKRQRGTKASRVTLTRRERQYLTAGMPDDQGKTSARIANREFAQIANRESRIANCPPSGGTFLSS